MEMRVFFLCLALGAGWILPSVRIDVKKDEYIELCTGEPCQWLKFRLNRSSSDIWLHSGAQSMLSGTFYAGAARQSELFYFDRHRLRLAVSLRPAPSVGLVATAPFDGTFGLGSGAEIWGYWDNYTLSTKRLQLGGRVLWAQRDPSEVPPVLDLGRVHSVALSDGTTTTLQFDLSRVESTVPYGVDLATVLRNITITSADCDPYHVELGLGAECQRVQTLLSDQYQAVTLTNGVTYEAVAYGDADALVVGTRFVESFAVFASMSCNCMVLAEDAFTLDYVALMATSALLLFSLLALWVVIAESPRDRETEWESRVLVSAELYSYLVDVLLFVTAHGALDWGRYVTHYAECPATFLWLYLAALLLASLALGMPWRELGANLLLRTVLFASCQIGFVWLAVVEEHETTFNRVLLALLCTLTTLLALTAAFFLALRQQWRSCVAAVAITGANAYFLIMFNLRPMFRYAHLRHSMTVSVFLWLYFFVAMPSLLLVATHDLMQRWRHARKNK